MYLKLTHIVNQLCFSLKGREATDAYQNLGQK